MSRRPRFATVSADAFRRLPSEEQMAAAIAEIVALKQGFYWHVEDTRTCPEMVNLWDTTALLPGGLLVAVELKSQGRPFESVDQARVCRMLEDVGRVVTGVVRPDAKPGEYSLDEILELLGSW